LFAIYETFRGERPMIRLAGWQQQTAERLVESGVKARPPTGATIGGLGCRSTDCGER